MILAVLEPSFLSTAFAQSYEGPRAFSLGEAARALCNPNDAIYLNPGALALSNRYSIELGALDDLSGGDRRINASISDSHDKALAGALAYTFRDRQLQGSGESETRAIVHRADLVLGLRGGEGWGLGAALRYLTASRFVDEVEDVTGHYRHLTVDLGIAWQGASGLALALAGYNLTNPEPIETPLSWGAGIGFRTDRFSIEANTRYVVKTGEPRISLGAALVVTEGLVLRAGGTVDTATENAAVSMGVGYEVGVIGFDIAFRQRVAGDVSPGLDSEHALALSLRAIPFGS